MASETKKKESLDVAIEYFPGSGGNERLHPIYDSADTGPDQSVATRPRSRQNQKQGLVVTDNPYTTSGHRLEQLCWLLVVITIFI
jgi:hypothetical protein